MDNSRRKFLKIAGITAVAGIGAPSALNMLMKSDVQASAAAHGEAVTGKRYGMVINARKFHEHPGLAEKCAEACHSNFNVPDFGNKKDAIMWLWAVPFTNAFPEKSHNKKDKTVNSMQIPVTCNHCDNPPCVKACPTQATFKNKDGIVMMDFHRCIGCRFCMAACPYQARSFNWRDPRGVARDGKPFIKKINMDFPTRMQGVVEKCNFCALRLTEGKLPICVEATGNTGAMVFGDLNDPNSDVSKVLQAHFTIQRKPTLGTKPSVFYII